LQLCRIRLIVLGLGVTFSVWGAHSVAQTVNVEIEVAGPWAYVADPGDTNRIIVIAPADGHLIEVFPGHDVTQPADLPQSPGLGVHRLEFATVPCGSPTRSTAKLFPLTVSDADVKAAIGATNKRYGISLPKPCYFESRPDSEARSKIGSSQSALTAPDKPYTTWMVLHYKMNGPTTTANLVVQPDSGGTSTKTLNFLSSPSGSTAQGISVIASMDTGPDQHCDKYSAEAFDAATGLWNQKFYRLFPEVDASSVQKPNYDTTCPPQGGAPAHPPAPTSPGKRHRLFPGRGDCHAAQLNVNKAVT
jgi:hypothetical protein